MGISLPDWAKPGTPTSRGVPIVHVDADKAYPAMLGELAAMQTSENERLKGELERHAAGTLAAKQLREQIRQIDADKPDRYWLEVAYQCMKLDLQVAMRTFHFEIRIHDAEKRWAQSRFPKGRGAEAATQGREAREIFRRMRGFIPG